MKSPPQKAKHLGFFAAPELVIVLEEHRVRLDDQRAEGAELTSMGTAIRNLIMEGNTAVRAREVKK